MLYEEVKIGQKVTITPDRQRQRGTATVEALNDQLQLVKLSFDLETKGIHKGRKTGTDGWWQPKFLLKKE